MEKKQCKQKIYAKMKSVDHFTIEQILHRAKLADTEVIEAERMDKHWSSY